MGVVQQSRLTFTRCWGETCCVRDSTGQAEPVLRFNTAAGGEEVPFQSIRTRAHKEQRASSDQLCRCEKGVVQWCAIQKHLHVSSQRIMSTQIPICETDEVCIWHKGCGYDLGGDLQSGFKTDGIHSRPSFSMSSCAQRSRTALGGPWR